MPSLERDLANVTYSRTDKTTAVSLDGSPIGYIVKSAGWNSGPRGGAYRDFYEPTQILADGSTRALARCYTRREAVMDLLRAYRSHEVIERECPNGCGETFEGTRYDVAGEVAAHRLDCDTKTAAELALVEQAQAVEKASQILGDDLYNAIVEGRHFSRDDAQLVGYITEGGTYIVASHPRMNDDNLRHDLAAITHDAAIPLRVTTAPGLLEVLSTAARSRMAYIAAQARA